MTDNNGNGATIEVDVGDLEELVRRGALTTDQIDDLRRAADAGPEARALAVPSERLDWLTGEGRLSAAQAELVRAKGKTERPFSLFNVRLTLSVVLIIIGVGVIAISLVGLFDVADTRLGRSLIIAGIMAAFAIVGKVVGARGSPLAGELLVLTGILLTPALAGGAAEGRAIPLSAVASAMGVLAGLGWYVRSPASAVYQALDGPKRPFTLSTGPFAVLILLIIVPALPFLILLLPVLATRYMRPHIFSDTLVMLSAAMTPALIVTIGYAADVDPGDWTGVVIVYPSLAVYAAGFVLSRRYPFYAALAGAAVLAAPLVTLLGFGQDQIGPRTVGAILAGTGAFVAAVGLAAEPRPRQSRHAVLSPTFWLDLAGLSALATGVGIALGDFDNNGVYAGFGALSGLLIAGGLAMRRLHLGPRGPRRAGRLCHSPPRRRRWRQRQLRVDPGRLGHHRRRPSTTAPESSGGGRRPTLRLSPNRTAPYNSLRAANAKRRGGTTVRFR